MLKMKLYTLISLKTDFQLLFNSNSRIKTFSEALNEYRENIGVKKRLISSSEVLTEKFRDTFDRNTIIDRIYSSICMLNTLLNSDGFMKLSEARNTVDCIQNIITKRVKIKTLQ